MLLRIWEGVGAWKLDSNGNVIVVLAHLNSYTTQEAQLTLETVTRELFHSVGRETQTRPVDDAQKSGTEKKGGGGGNWGAVGGGNGR